VPLGAAAGRALEVSLGAAASPGLAVAAAAVRPREVTDVAAAARPREVADAPAAASRELRRGLRWRDADRSIARGGPAVRGCIVGDDRGRPDEAAVARDRAAADAHPPSRGARRSAVRAAEGQPGPRDSGARARRRSPL